MTRAIYDETHELFRKSVRPWSTRYAQDVMAKVA